MHNEVLDTIMTRRSIRAYSQKQITAEQLDALCKAALIAPTAMNLQTWHFTVIQNKELLNELEADVVEVLMKSNNEATIERIKSRNNKIIYNAPTLFILSAESSEYSRIDAGIAVQTIALAAKSMGLDSVILGMLASVFKGEKANYWREKMQFPENFEIVISIAVGTAAMEASTREIDMKKLVIIK